MLKTQKSYKIMETIDWNSNSSVICAYHSAIRAGNVEIVKHIINNYNNITSMHKCAWYSLIRAFSMNHFDVVEYVIQYAFATINIADTSAYFLDHQRQYHRETLNEIHAITYFTSKNVFTKSQSIHPDVIIDLFKERKFDTLNLLLCTPERLKTVATLDLNIQKSLSNILNLLLVNSLLKNKCFHDVVIRTQN